MRHDHRDTAALETSHQCVALITSMTCKALHGPFQHDCVHLIQHATTKQKPNNMKGRTANKSGLVGW